MSLIELPARRPAWVYRAYCKHGGLLYVGITGALSRRLAQHRKHKPWWRHEVARVIAYQFPDRASARRAELAAITYDQPFYNVEGVIPNAQYDANRWANEFGTYSLPSRYFEYQAEAI